VCAQSLGDVNASDWQLTELSADDVTEYSELVNEVGEAVTSSGVRRLRYVLTDLSTNTSYTARLRATNIFGTSDWSTEFSFQTAAQRAYIIGPLVTPLVFILVFNPWDLYYQGYKNNNNSKIAQYVVCLKIV